MHEFPRKKASLEKYFLFSTCRIAPEYGRGILSGPVPVNRGTELGGDSGKEGVGSL